MMPFGNYKNFAECVKANSHRKDANAYCATVMRRTKDKPALKKFAPIFKSANITHADHNQVFGWASVVITKDGQIVDDLQGHRISVGELESAAYQFVEDGFASGEMHLGKQQGVLIESMVFTPEKMARMGLAKGSLPVGWWVGFQMPPEVFAKVKSGLYRMFSIQGAARLIPID